MVDDLVRSVIVKILHSVKGGDVEQWLEPQKIIVFVIAYSLFSLYFLFNCLHSNIVYLFASIS